MFNLSEINARKDLSFETVDQVGVTAFENCKLCGQFRVDGIAKIKKCLFLEKAIFKGTINISESKFEADLISIGTTIVKNSALDKAYVEGLLNLERVSADKVSVKSREVFLKACKINELVINDSVEKRKQIVHLSDECIINKVIFEDSVGEIRCDKRSRIAQIINGATQQDKEQKILHLLEKSGKAVWDLGSKFFRSNSVIPSDV